MPETTAPPTEGLAELSMAECERRLLAGGVGILAMVGVTTPVQRPINFVFHEKTIILLTGEGQILEAAQFAEPASFAIFEVDRFEHTGWSVVVTGKLMEQPNPDEGADLSLRPWVRADKRHRVALAVDQISGRRIGATDASP